MSTALLVVVAGLSGLVAGPILHHLGARAAFRRDFDGLTPRCEHCSERRRFPWLELRCRNCGVGVRRREPIIWMLAGFGFVGAVSILGASWLVWSHLWLVCLTLVLVVTDLDNKLIPNRVLFPGTGVAAAALAVGALLEGRAVDLVRAFEAGALWFGLLYLVALIARGGFGFGDVKLAFVLGLFAGFWSWRTLAMALFLTAILGGLPALVMILTRRARKTDELPYGPAMVFGTWMAIALTVQALV